MRRGVIAVPVFALADLLVVADPLAVLGTVGDGSAPETHRIAHHSEDTIFVLSAQCVIQPQQILWWPEVMAECALDTLT